VHRARARNRRARGVKGICALHRAEFLVNADGTLENATTCFACDRAQAGHQGEPTAVLQYGNHGGAVSTWWGEENRGLEYMFIMMNAARYAVGMQGIAVAEGGYQKAVDTRKSACSRALSTARRPLRRRSFTIPT